jgi:hypothetical protein
LHIRPTPQAKEFVQKWKEKVATSTIAWMRDQPALNLLTREGNPPLRPAVSVPDDKKGLPGYRSIVYAANSTIRMGVLPLAQFSNGHTFFVQQHHIYHPEDGAPYAVHTTYQYGDSKEYAYGKRQRLRQHGLWFVEDDEYWSSGKYLTISTRGSQVEFSGDSSIPSGDDADAYKTAISRHFDEDRLRRVSIRNGLALAKALGRIFVLPPARCYCDKIWNTLKGCRALGAATSHLPFECPMDHIYTLPHWFSLDVDFRPAGFLEDERFPAKYREDVIHVRVGDNSITRNPDVILNRGFTANDAINQLKDYSANAVIMFDSLEDGTFCGFGNHDEDFNFDHRVLSALKSDQYFCFDEAYDEQGRPRGGMHGEEWEPRVVERHCGVPETQQRTSATRGVVTEILKNPLTCSCEWAYADPTPLTATQCSS